MKKILFVTNKLITGGIETALLETIKLIKSPDVDITVLTIHEGGELVDKFKEICTVNHIPQQQVKQAFLYRSYLIEQLRKFRIFSFITKTVRKLINKFIRSFYTKKSYIAKRLSFDNVEYDIAVSYFTPYSVIVPLVTECIKAKQKIAYIHQDVYHDARKKNASTFSACYQKFNKIVCVSEAVKTSFINYHPNLANKVSVIYNPIDVDKILQLSQQGTPLLGDEKDIQICSVGRLSEAKNFELAINSCKILVDKGYHIKWYVCGDGSLRNSLETNVKTKKLERSFVFLGNQNNPYPYICASQIYVQTSRIESYCITLAEARALKKPIVTTNFPCASEHIIHKHNGFICEMTPESIADSIEKLILSPELREKFSNNTTPIDSDYTKLTQLFE